MLFLLLTLLLLDHVHLQFAHRLVDVRIHLLQRHLVVPVHIVLEVAFAFLLVFVERKTGQLLTSAPDLLPLLDLPRVFVPHVLLQMSVVLDELRL